jgi:hypothetical protein
MKKAYIAPECATVQMPEYFCQQTWNINGSDVTTRQY